MRRPNIVLILIDDLGWADLSCYGSEFYETPNIDQLASEGVLFTDAYAAAPVCSPTRASLLTGKYPARLRLTQYIGGHGVGRLADVPHFHRLPENEYTIARALRAHGYATWHVGKWHLGGRHHLQRSWPEEHGFDVNIGGCELGYPGSFFSPYGIENLEDGPEGEYLTDRLTDEAIALIAESDQQPFFLNLWHYAVHIPIQAPADLVEKYRDKATRLGLDGSEIIRNGEAMTAWHLDGQVIRHRTLQSDPDYAAMIENLDDNVGRLLEALRRFEKLDNTIVIFTSDNGGLATAEGSPTCNAPLSDGKGWMSDGGTRVPFIIRAPERFLGGTVEGRPLTSPDVYPTLLNFAGLEELPQQHVDGRALTNDGEARGPIYWHYPHYSNQGGRPGAAVRDGAYKLIRFFEDDRRELYNLENDIGESCEIGATEPGECARLGRLLDAWIEEVNALLPQENPYDLGFRFPSRGA